MATTKALVRAMTKAITRTNGHAKTAAKNVKVKHVHHHHHHKAPSHTHITLFGPQEYPMVKTGRIQRRKGRIFFEYRCTFNYNCSTAWRSY
jgi:hypothetical protein